MNRREFFKGALGVAVGITTTCLLQPIQVEASHMPVKQRKAPRKHYCTRSKFDK